MAQQQQKITEGAFYDVGCCIDALHESKNNRNKDGKEKSGSNNKNNNISFYGLSCIVNVCLADGKLGLLEEKYIKKLGKSWKLNENEMTQVLKGKNYIKEYNNAIEKNMSQLFDNNNNTKTDEKLKYKEKSQRNLILFALLAASQDGLLKKEYSKVEKLAKDIGCDDNIIKEEMEIVDLEMKFAKTFDRRHGQVYH